MQIQLKAPIYITGTIRRYLEQNKTPQLVILTSECGPDVALMTALAPLYFPRNAREADAARWRLPDAGGPTGEPTHPERRIRIIHNPHSHNSDSGKHYHHRPACPPIRSFLSVDLRINLCEELILSKINYITSYGSFLLSRTHELLQRVQNACARF